MITADAVRDDASPEKKPDEPKERGPSETPRRLAPSSPISPAAWLLRSAAIAATIAGFLAAIVAPGVQGNASERVVVWTGWGSSAFAFFLLLLLVTLAVWGAVELLRAHGLPAPARGLLLGGGAVVVAMSSPGLRDRLPPLYSSVIALAAVVAALAGAYASAGAPHTRAVAAVLAVLSLAALARFGAWWVAVYAGDAASVKLFYTARGLATAGVLFEAAGQLLAVTWLSTRSRGGGFGQLGAFVALGSAVVLTWGVAQGVHSSASLWQAVLHTALADAPGVPPPYGFDALATFLVPASLLLALATAAQPKQVVAVLVAMALALVSRGAFDAPLRALCAVVAAYWVVLARGDEQAMWKTLIRERQARLEEEGEPRDPARPTRSVRSS
jgi:hypothetical protein